MSVFRNIRTYPSHGSRTAVVTWEMAEGTDAGDVYVAYSSTGTDGSWQALNPQDPVPSELGMFQHDRLVINKGAADAWYRLMLTTDDGEDLLSAPIQVMGDLTPREYGIVRAAIHQEYTQMRVTNGFPVWHCIPKSHGEPADNLDPDTGAQTGEECDLSPEENSYGLPFKGGFYPPILTWMRVLVHNEGLQDDPEEFSTDEIHKTSVRLMAFPRPSRGHMIVDPTTDRRYLVGDEVKPLRFRGVIATAYLATLEFLGQKDERYKFPVPFIDTKEYRRIPNWTPQTLTVA